MDKMRTQFDENSEIGEKLCNIISTLFDGLLGRGEGGLVGIGRPLAAPLAGDRVEGDVGGNLGHDSIRFCVFTF